MFLILAKTRRLLDIIGNLVISGHKYLRTIEDDFSQILLTNQTVGLEVPAVARAAKSRS